VEPTDDSKVPWLKGRLDRATESGKKALLKDLGTDNLDEIKAALEIKRQSEEAKKTLEQKAAEAAAEIERYKAELATYKAATAAQATETLSKLPADRRAAIASLAGDDPAKQLDAYRVLYPTWIAADNQAAAQAAAAQAAAQAQAAAVAAAVAAAPPPAPAAPAAPAAPVPPPAPVAAPPAVLPPAASTAPAPSAPAPASTQVASYLATYEHLKQVNPVKAAVYLTKWGAQISAERNTSNQARG
jgi:DNA-binding transcriptional MerR regulator